MFINLDETVAYPKELLKRCSEMGLTVHLNLAKATNGIVGKQSVGKVGEYTVLTTSINVMTMKQAFIKRGVDIFAGLLGCVATCIIYIFVAPAIYIASPGPIFFKQERVGQNGRKFNMYKFRTMYLDAEERKKNLLEQNQIADGMMFKMENDPRIIGSKIDQKTGEYIPGIGNWIRKLSLDEFPQFFNVLRGDMSLVGTRPPTVDEYEKYKLHHKARLSVKPGITGLWQVSGRSEITDFEEVVKLDTEYICHWSMANDIKILLRTVQVVISGKGSM